MSSEEKGGRPCEVVSDRRNLIWIAAAGIALGAMLTLGPKPEAAPASSHREAPLISEDPTADNTDVYAFVSPDRPDSVTLVANYVPLEEPAGGPNFAKFGDDVLYALHVDSDGDADDDVTYEFRFRTQVRNPDTFLYNTGPITSLTDPDWNIRQTYTVTRAGPGSARGARRGPADAAGEHRPALDAELRRARRGGACRSCRAASRSSPGSATTRSSSTSARCSTWPACGRSTRST